MKTRIAIWLFFLSLLFSGIVITRLFIAPDTAYHAAQPIASPTPFALSSEKLMTVVNDWRISQGFQPYKNSDFLCNVASIRVKEAKENWSHNKFSAARFCGETKCWLGENLARNQIVEKDVLKDWLNSPSHRDLLTTSYTHACIATDELYTALITGYF